MYFDRARQRKKPPQRAPSLRDGVGFSQLFSARTVARGRDIRQDYLVLFCCPNENRYAVAVARQGIIGGRFKYIHRKRAVSYEVKNCFAPQKMRFLRKTRRRRQINLTVICLRQRSISQISALLAAASSLSEGAQGGVFVVT